MRTLEYRKQKPPSLVEDYRDNEQRAITHLLHARPQAKRPSYEWKENAYNEENL